MANETCVLQFEDVSSDRLKEYLDSECENISSAADCLKEAKNQFGEAVLPLTDNVNLIDTINILSIDQFGPDSSIVPVDENGARTTDANTKSQIRDYVESFFLPVKEDVTELSDIYEFYSRYYSRADPAQQIREADSYTKTREILEKLRENSTKLAQNDDVVVNYSLDKEQLNGIINASSEALGIIKKAEECAKTLHDIEKEHKNISQEDVGLAVTGRGEFSGQDAEERNESAQNSLNQKLDSGEGIFLLSLSQDFSEQCIMLAQIWRLSEYHREKELENSDLIDSTPKELPYTMTNQEENASLIIEGEPFGLINKLTQYPSMGNFFDATNDQLAHLQPMIRFFKVEPIDSAEEVQREFPFDTFASKEDVADVFNNKARRGFGAGIQNFNFTYDGSNPFSAKKSIKATLTIRANNFEELLRDRGNGLKYIDLALKTGTAIQEKYDKSDLNFRIKAVVGVSLPNGLTTPNFKQIQEAVKNNYVTLNLTPVTHEFDFDDTGAVIFKIQYFAYIDEYLDKPLMNIFAVPTIYEQVIRRRLAIKTQKKACESEKEVEALNKFITDDAEQVKNDKLQSLKSLTELMYVEDKIYYLSLSRDNFLELINKGPFYDLEADGGSIISVDDSETKEKIINNMTEAFESSYSGEEVEDNKSLKNSFRLSNLHGMQIPFFYLGDLVDLVLKQVQRNLTELSTIESTSYRGLEIDDDLRKQQEIKFQNSSEAFKKFRFVLGPMEIIDHTTKNQRKVISFADLPISLNYFNEWLTSRLLAKDEAEYGLLQFLKDLMNNLVSEFLNDDSCYSFNTKQRVRVFESAITSYSDGIDAENEVNDNITSYLLKNKKTRLMIDEDSSIPIPLLQPAGPRDLDIPMRSPESEFHFFVFYAGRVQPENLMTGNPDADRDAGIFHYILGRDRGIVKTIKLNKTDAPGLKEVRFEQEGYDGLRQLREIYDVNTTTFTNVQAFPGTYIFVEPQGFSPNLGKYDLDKFDLTDLGIGGYYMIIRSTHEFGPGRMESNITAKWVQSLDSENEEAGGKRETGDGEATPKKCTVKVK